MEVPESWGKPEYHLSADPLLSTLSTGQAPQFSMSSIQLGDSTCIVQEEHEDPGAAW